MSNLPSISLEFREGSSDKVYKAAVEEASGGFVVNFAFGRRGSTLNTGTKTNSPVPLAEATKIYDKLVLSKTCKGYKPTGAAGGIASSITAAVTDRDQRDTGLRPQLLNPITEAEAEVYLLNNDWGAQEKYDGKRMTIQKAAAIIAANKKGLSIGFPDAIASGLSVIREAFVTDGEAIGDRLFAFDLLEHNGVDLRNDPYINRYDKLVDVLTGVDAVVVSDLAIGQAAKRKLMADLKAAGKEGIVFKRLSARWYAGRPESGGDAVKCKFWSSASCVVSKVNAKRSISVSLSGESVGNVTIPPNKEIPSVGDVVEIKYLYVKGVGGSLYQPIYIGPRDDVDPSECTFEQQKLKYRAEDDE
jgi:bifunctional non-homologous end joining protein LigD